MNNVYENLKLKYSKNVIYRLSGRILVGFKTKLEEA